MLWPAAVPEVPRAMGPSTRQGREEQAQASRARRAERTRMERARREAQWRAAAETHRWVSCGTIQRCGCCQLRRVRSVEIARCAGIPGGLRQWASSARQQRHTLAIAALFHHQHPEVTVPIVI